MNKTIIIIFSIVTIISIYCYFYRNALNTMDEGFENLIKNGNFDNAEKSSDVSVMNENNKIITLANPGNTPYVLEQSSVLSKGTKYPKDTSVSYIIQSVLQQKKHYLFSCWVTYTEDWNGKNSMFYIKIWNTNNDPTIIVNNGNIVNSKQIESNTWELRQYSIQLPQNATGHIEWHLGNNPENTKGTRYVTDIKIDTYYPLLKELRVTDYLECMLSSFNNLSYSGSSKEWKDITTNDNNFVWTQSPQWNKLAGFSTKDNVLRGKSLTNMNISVDKPEFTIVWFGQTRINTQGLFTVIPNLDSQNNISILINAIDNSLVVKQGNNIVGTYNIGLSSMDLMYSITYKDGNMHIYINDIEITEKKPLHFNKKIHLNHSDFIINPNSGLAMNIYNLAIYSTDLSKKNIGHLYKYFIHILSKHSGSIVPKPMGYNHIQKPDILPHQKPIMPKIHKENIHQKSNSLLDDENHQVIQQQDNYWLKWV